MSEASGQEKSPDDGASAVPKVEGKSILRNVEDDLVAQQRDRLRRNGEHLSLLCCGEAGCGKVNCHSVRRVSLMTELASDALRSSCSFRFPSEHAYQFSVRAAGVCPCSS